MHILFIHFLFFFCIVALCMFIQNTKNNFIFLIVDRLSAVGQQLLIILCQSIKNSWKVVLLFQLEKMQLWSVYVSAWAKQIPLQSGVLHCDTLRLEETEDNSICWSVGVTPTAHLLLLAMKLAKLDYSI